MSESYAQGDSSRIIPLACDISSFDSVHKFADNLQKVGSNSIDVACLNAGICTARGSEPQFTKDNLELTVCHQSFCRQLSLDASHCKPHESRGAGSRDC